MVDLGVAMFLLRMGIHVNIETENDHFTPGITREGLCLKQERYDFRNQTVWKDYCAVLGTIMAD